jgi:hypothetical protein
MSAHFTLVGVDLFIQVQRQLVSSKTGQPYKASRCQALDRKQVWSCSFGPASRETLHEYILIARCIYLFMVYSCPIGAVLVGALLVHIDSMPTQPYKKLKHEPYIHSEKAVGNI